MTKAILETNPMCFKFLSSSLVVDKSSSWSGIKWSNSFKNKKHLVTLLLVDKNYPNIKIERGKIILWQDIQYK